MKVSAFSALRALTPARIAIGRAGSGVPTTELLGFGLAHARARDAVHRALDVEAVVAGLRGLGLSPSVAHSAAPDRASYLRRPDLGRRLGEGQPIPKCGNDIGIVIADGLSALAVERHAVPLVSALVSLAPQRWAGAGAVVALQGRVALGDGVGSAMGAKLVVVLIGERPGLSSPDSLGAYLTWAPRVGRVDAERNCVSNIRPQGLGCEAAARRVDWLVAAGLARGLTGVGLKEESGLENQGQTTISGPGGRGM